MGRRAARTEGSARVCCRAGVLCAHKLACFVHTSWRALCTQAGVLCAHKLACWHAAPLGAHSAAGHSHRSHASRLAAGTSGSSTAAQTQTTWLLLPGPCRYSAQAAGHQLLLSQFEEAMARLEACPLHPRLATPAWRRLADLQPPARVREWRDKCARSHDSFANKVRCVGVRSVCNHGYAKW